MGRFHGIFTPLITPILPDERPDIDSMRRLAGWQIARGVHGLWAMGTSGEFAGFNRAERAEIIGAVTDEVAGRVPVVANVSDASTRRAIEHARDAAETGADAIAATPPYYYPHTQDEVLDHFRRIRTAVPLPLFIYNIPQTVRVRVELATAVQLTVEGTVQGIKDSQNDLESFRQLILAARRNGKPFAAFAGTRHLIDAAMVAGADGAIPSLANAFPRLCVSIYEAAASGDMSTASRLQTEAVDLEAINTTVPGGSRNAAVLSVLKGLLVEGGIIERRDLTAPLRTIDEATWQALLARYQSIAGDLLPAAGQAASA